LVGIILFRVAFISKRGRGSEIQQKSLVSIILLSVAVISKSKNGGRKGSNIFERLCHDERVGNLSEAEAFTLGMPNSV